MRGKEACSARWQKVSGGRSAGDSAQTGGSSGESDRVRRAGDL